MIVCVVRVTGVEPAWYCYHKNLNLTRLPISPYPQILSDKFYTARTLRGQTHIFSHKCFTAEVKLSFADIRLKALKRFLIRLINIANFIAFCQPFSWLYNAILKIYLSASIKKIAFISAISVKIHFQPLGWLFLELSTTDSDINRRR